MTRLVFTLTALQLAVASVASAQLPSRNAIPQDSLALSALNTPNVPTANTSNTPNANTPTTIDPIGYEIGPEDVLDISVWKSPELSRTVPVRPDGKVSLPLVNDIQAAGFTPSELRQQIVTRLTDFVPSPEVSVIVREVHSRKVAVVGAVKTAGRYELKGPMTVLEVIALAQGFTDFATRDRIVVLRQTGATTTRIPFNYRKISEGAEQENFYVHPGDIIVVP
jgi:polysaccharide export outer membrane protein